MTDDASSLITGSSGLIGSEAAAFFDRRGWDGRTASTTTCARDFFGPDGDTTLEPASGCARARAGFTHHELDIRDRDGIADAGRSSRGPT